MMEFCPNCGKVLTLVKKSDTVVLVCKKCGFEKVVEKAVTQVASKKKAKVPTVEKEAPSEEEVLPTVDVICPECGNNKAYWWTVQTRSADEPMTTFFRCTRCKHTWREYG
jgi:DNA-directed RNA polymerase subunit M